LNPFKEWLIVACCLVLGIALDILLTPAREAVSAPYALAVLVAAARMNARKVIVVGLLAVIAFLSSSYFDHTIPASSARLSPQPTRLATDLRVMPNRARSLIRNCGDLANDATSL
jgi:hypothetical protein